MADPDGAAGVMSIRSTHPHRGLAVARMAAHITYLSDAALHRSSGGRSQDRELPTFSFDADFQVESYLRYQGSSFIDALRCQQLSLPDAGDGLFRHRRRPQWVLAQAFRGIKTRFCVVIVYL